MGDSFGTLGGHGRELFGARGLLRGNREPQVSPWAPPGCHMCPPRTLREGTWAPQGDRRVIPEVASFQQPLRTCPASSYRHDLSVLDY